MAQVLTRDESAPFQSDSLAYTLRAGATGYDGTLRILYTNRTMSSTSFANCNGATNYALEKKVGSGWVWAWFPIIPACISAPIVVPPGGSHTFSVYVFGGYPDCRCAPRFGVTEIDGEYRVVWRSGVSSSAAIGDSLSSTARSSNRFLLTASSHP